jgi:hypothetical protein
MRGAIGELNKVIRSIGSCFEHNFYFLYFLFLVPCTFLPTVLYEKSRICFDKCNSGLIARVSIQTTKMKI